jgi:hypothetical protein
VLTKAVKNVSRTIEVMANVAIILVAILLGIVLINRYLIAPRLPISESAVIRNQPPSNVKIRVDGVDWTRKNKTLVLAISSTCHFCTESAPFYRQLAGAHESTQLIAVLPQPVTEGRRYVSRLGLEVDDVVQAPLNSINVNGTPTLLLVNRDGDVTGTWVGRLPADQEAEVLTQVKADNVQN